MDDLREEAEIAAWREYGKRNMGWIVGWRIVKTVAPVVVFVVPAGLLVWWILRTVGSLSAPGRPNSSPVSAGPWPWMLFGISAATAIGLAVYRWANPYNGGKRLIVAIVVCVLISVLAILWARAAT